MRNSNRNSIIHALDITDISREEKIAFLSISSLLGDLDEMDIDWDDLSEITGYEDYSVIEGMLDTMYDMEILEILDYEIGCFG